MPTQILSRPTNVIQCLFPCKCIEEYQDCLQGEQSKLFKAGDIVVYDHGDGETIGTVVYSDKELTDVRGEVRTDTDGIISVDYISRFATWDDLKSFYHWEIENDPAWVKYGLPKYPKPPLN